MKDTSNNNVHISSGLDLISRAPVSLSKALIGLEKEFLLDYKAYKGWLQRRMERIMGDGHNRPILGEIGIDWVTVHYKTRHQASSPDSLQWIQRGLPIKKYMKEHTDKLQVYGDQASPYIRFFARAMVERVQPIRILFAPKEYSEQNHGWLTIPEDVVNLLKEATEGGLRQETLPPEFEEKIRTDFPNVHAAVLKEFCQFSNSKQLPGVEAFDGLRNACRVTLLALRLEDAPQIELPRYIMLSPVYTPVEDNLIGGIAYIGRKMPNDQDTLILSSFANLIVSGLRLWEEPLVEAQVGQLDALNRDRARFVHKVAHSVLSPMDSLMVRIGEMARAWEKIGSLVADWRHSTEYLRSAFDDDASPPKADRRNVNIRELIELLIFVYSGPSESQIEIKSSQIPNDWTVWSDKTQLFDVLANLIGNAKRYARSRILLEVDKCPERNLCRFKVSDDGPGVAQDRLDSLFKPRGSSRGPGHGYGLFFGKQDVEAHGGSLYLDREYKKGARFVVELPAGTESEE